MITYAITCACGHEISGTDKRTVEAQMWQHAIQEHGDMMKTMSSDQLLSVMQGWDKKFAENEGR